MLKRLSIKNFKGWKDTGAIRMAPISLFFGANSSGKSSIGQFLMMLKQTVESPEPPFSGEMKYRRLLWPR
jgi:AAA15 family ATPase/GTPase